MTGSTAITKIAIAGHGVEAWLTANHLLAALGRQQVEIVVCPVPGSDELDELYSIAPAWSDNGLGAIGLSSSVLARDCAASFSLGAEIAGQLKPYGNTGLDFLGVPFYHHWLRTDSSEGAAGYFNWSPGKSAMQQSAFAPPAERNAIGTLQHAMATHVDTGHLTRLLSGHAMRFGVKVTTGNLETVNRISGSDRITELLSSQGEAVEADLYIDCSGPQRSLQKGVSGQSWVNAPGLPRFHVAISRNDQQGAPRPFHRINAIPEGWELEVPGPDRLSRITFSTATADKQGQEFTPGYLSKPWLENCLALGSAAASILPIEPMQARFLAVSLKNLLELLPGRDCNPAETGEYNHLAISDLVEMNDMLATYELARKSDGLYLSAADIEKTHGSLHSRLSLFTHRGWIAPGDSGFLDSNDWAGAFILLGLLPGKRDRLAERLPLDTLNSHMQKLKAQIEKTVSEFPSHADYLDALKLAARVAPKTVRK